MKKLTREEPARLFGAVAAAVGAVIALLVAFGIDVTDEQRTAILGVTTTVLPLAAALVIRERVYSPATVKEIKVEAKVDAIEAAAKAQARIDAANSGPSIKDVVQRAQEQLDRVPGPDHRADPRT